MKVAYIYLLFFLSRFSHFHDLKILVMACASSLCFRFLRLFIFHSLVSLLSFFPSCVAFHCVLLAGPRFPWLMSGSLSFSAALFPVSNFLILFLCLPVCLPHRRKRNAHTHARSCVYVYLPCLFACMYLFMLQTILLRGGVDWGRPVSSNGFKKAEIIEYSIYVAYYLFMLLFTFCFNFFDPSLCLLPF